MFGATDAFFEKIVIDPNLNSYKVFSWCIVTLVSILFSCHDVNCSSYFVLREFIDGFLEKMYTLCYLYFCGVSHSFRKFRLEKIFPI